MHDYQVGKQKCRRCAGPWIKRGGQEYCPACTPQFFDELPGETQLRAVQRAADNVALAAQGNGTFPVSFDYEGVPVHNPFAAATGKHRIDPVQVYGEAFLVSGFCVSEVIFIPSPELSETFELVGVPLSDDVRALALEFIEEYDKRGFSWSAGKWEPACRSYLGYATGVAHTELVEAVRAEMLARECI